MNLNSSVKQKKKKKSEKNVKTKVPKLLPRSDLSSSIRYTGDYQGVEDANEANREIPRYPICYQGVTYQAQ